MFVSNTSTLVLLAKVGCLEVFIDIAPNIEIPSQVKEEALFKKGSYYARLIHGLIEDKRIIVKGVKDTVLQNILSEFRLDKGEAAAYSLYNPKKHRAILTDDGELIKLCKLENIPFICSMAIIVRLYEKKKLKKDNAQSILKKLSVIGRYSEDLYEHFRSEVK